MRNWFQSLRSNYTCTALHNELRDLKKEIEHLQMLLEQSRKRLQTVGLYKLTL